MLDLDRTIVAEATAGGRAPLRVVRLSGGGAIDLLRGIFRPEGAVVPWSRPRLMALGDVVDPEGRVLDRALAVCFPAPASLTGEDVVEIHLHGAPGVVRAVLDILTEGGARPAMPGEFSYRAVLNGKMDVLQAEAVQALIDAESEGQVREFAEGLGGESACSVALAGLRDALVGLRASWEARVDFPEDVSASPRAAEMADLDDVIDGFVDAAESGKRLRYLREGLRVALVGPVNSGKSSLFNAILKRERALVTPHPGTTRDTLEESIQVAGFPLVLIDTAGIRETVEPVERLGVERSLEAARRADGTILVYDGTKGWGRDEEAVLAALPERPLAILANKADLPGHGAGKSGTVSSSVVTGQGLASVVEALGAWVEERVPRGSVVMASERQADCVRRALEGCLRAREALKAGFTEEVALQGIKNAQDAMDELFGGGSPEELYDRIFSSFCIGK